MDSALFLLALPLLASVPNLGTKPKPRPWVGVHIGAPSDAQSVADLKELIREGLKPKGVNTLIIEFTSDNFRYQSIPELKAYTGGIDAKIARDLADFCRKEGFWLIPQLNCVGHQSWAKTTFGLLKAFRDIDETPGQFPDNEGIYCRSWCTSNPKSYELTFKMIDELVDAFRADAFHVGMDEIFLIGHESCKLCRGKDPAALMANAVHKLHAHVAKKRGLTMLMWGDRFLDAKATGYGEWEGAANGTAPAIDKIPKDIVICDWHYEVRADYPSIRIFADKGFPVWPSGWNKAPATEAFLKASEQVGSPQVMGHLFTTWGGSPKELLLAIQSKPNDPKPERAGYWWEVGRIIGRYAPTVAQTKAFGGKPD